MIRGHVLKGSVGLCVLGKGKSKKDDRKEATNEGRTDPESEQRDGGRQIGDTELILMNAKASKTERKLVQ